MKASDFKMAGDAMQMRIVMQFDREPDPKWFLLRGPHRLVIDLPETAFVVEPKALKARGLVSNVRYGALNEGTSRLILTAKGPFAVDKVDVLANEDGQGYRLVADISASSDRKFDAGARRSGADHRLDRLDAEGRPRRQAAAGRSGQALHRRHRPRPWRHRRRRRRPQRHRREERSRWPLRASSATSSPKQANTMSS